jgi:hypothetical protein
MKESKAWKMGRGSKREKLNSFIINHHPHTSTDIQAHTNIHTHTKTGATMSTATSTSTSSPPPPSLARTPSERKGKAQWGGSHVA